MGRVIHLAAGLFLAAAPLAAATDRADDDLAVVRRALGDEAASAAETPARPTPPPPVRALERAGRTRSGRSPAWLKIRVVENGGRGKGSRITVKLPLVIARSLGDAFPVHLHDSEPRLRLGEILRALESGEPLVEVKKPDASVRIWLE